MCGFVVAISVPGLADDEWQSSLQSLESRGPDDSGELQLPIARFGHRRLSIIGLGTEGKQPLTDGRYILVFNGEIYNYQELAQMLGIRARSDTQVLFEMAKLDLKVWLPRIRGMYAFVHLDSQTGEVSAARDPFGIKPLYFRRHSEYGLSLGSTVASVANLDKSLHVNYSTVANFLAWGFAPSGESFFDSIHKLSPGTLTTWRPGKDSFQQDTSWVIPIGDWPVRSIEESIRDSVKTHLIADVDVGVFLSGGIDSTLLAALGQRFDPSLTTFTISNRLNPSIDESLCAQRNARLLNLRNIQVPVTTESLAAQAAGIIATSGEPFSDAAFLPLSLLSAVASNEVKVVIAGEGADELFGGYRRYDIEAHLDNPIYGPLIQLVAKGLQSRKRDPHYSSGLSRVLAAAALGSPIERHASLMYSSWPAVLTAFDRYAVTAWENTRSNWDDLTKDQWAFGMPCNRAFDLRTWLPNVFLEKSDRASMAHGLEVRVPYLDPVVALASLAFKPRNSSKAPLRALLKETLPSVCLPKRKKGLAVDSASLNTHFRGALDFALYSRDSILAVLAPHQREGLVREASHSSAFAFRLSMLGLWNQKWLT